MHVQTWTTVEDARTCTDPGFTCFMYIVRSCNAVSGKKEQVKAAILAESLNNQWRCIDLSAPAESTSTRSLLPNSNTTCYYIQDIVKTDCVTKSPLLHGDNIQNTAPTIPS
jgi:hypothetical protein